MMTQVKLPPFAAVEARLSYSIKLSNLLLVFQLRMVIC